MSIIFKIRNVKNNTAIQQNKNKIKQKNVITFKHSEVLRDNCLVVQVTEQFLKSTRTNFIFDDKYTAHLSYYRTFITKMLGNCKHGAYTSNITHCKLLN